MNACDWRPPEAGFDPIIWERLNDKVTCRIKVEKEVYPFEVEDRTPIFAILSKYADEVYTAFHNCLKDFKYDIIH